MLPQSSSTIAQVDQYINLKAIFNPYADACHKLNYLELGTHFTVEFKSQGKDYVAKYKTFKLEDEADKYRLRLGAVTSSVDGGSHGLSYSNNAFFSTVDRDNDGYGTHCAATRKCGWWFKNCELSKLTSPWREGEVYQAWHNGSKWLSATRTEMKIRPLK
ncbi:angiopoietin-related protein 2 [Elysia marginata]|uniref:Angiopoietin-related protein 2 n=1 Tax=Elysia marginata TaxID=1093978 RepID=A0AAV4HSD8_9GAST|nr:angiopoietin-related protein 2 [Elysia marginata]